MQVVHMVILLEKCFKEKLTIYNIRSFGSMSDLEKFDFPNSSRVAVSFLLLYGIIKSPLFSEDITVSSFIHVD